MTVNETYKKNLDEVKELINNINKIVSNLEEKQEQDPYSWVVVQDLAAIKDGLEDIVKGFPEIKQ